MCESVGVVGQGQVHSNDFRLLSGSFTTPVLPSY